MNYEIQDDRLYKMIDKYIKQMFGEIVMESSSGKKYTNFWGTNEEYAPEPYGNQVVPPYELNQSGVLWNNLGTKSPHLTLGEIFGLDADELFMFYLEKNFPVNIKGMSHEEYFDEV